MAINRLVLVCVQCKEDIPIARLQVGMDGVWLPSRVKPEEYEAWLLKHGTHDPEHPVLNVRLGSENPDNIWIED